MVSSGCPSTGGQTGRRRGRVRLLAPARTRNGGNAARDGAVHGGGRGGLCATTTSRIASDEHACGTPAVDCAAWGRSAQWGGASAAAPSPSGAQHPPTRSPIVCVLIRFPPSLFVVCAFGRVGRPAQPNVEGGETHALRAANTQPETASLGHQQAGRRTAPTPPCPSPRVLRIAPIVLCLSRDLGAFSRLPVSGRRQETAAEQAQAQRRAASRARAATKQVHTTQRGFLSTTGLDHRWCI